MLQLIRYTSGESRVIDTDQMIASEFLHHSDLDAPLEDYSLDHKLAPEDLADGTYIVVRES